MAPYCLANRSSVVLYTALFLAFITFGLTRTAVTRGAVVSRGAPVAVSVSGGDLFVLERDGGLSVASAATGAFQGEVFRVRKPYDAVDIVAIGGASPATFMAVSAPVSFKYAGWVVRVPPQGKAD